VKFKFLVKVFIILVCQLAPSLSPAMAEKPGKTDSLLLALGKAKTDTNKVTILLLLSKQYLSVNLPKAMNYANQAYQIALDQEDEKMQVKCMLSLAVLNYTCSNYAVALDLDIKAMDLAVKHKMNAEIGLALDAIGVIYSDLGNNDKSAEYFFSCLKLNETLKDTRGISESMSRIGILYYKQKNYSKALEYLTNSLQITRDLNAKDGISSNLNSIANVYADQKNYQKALSFYMESLAIANENGDFRRQGTNSLSIGTTYLKMKNYQLALQYLQKALDIFQKLNNEMRIAKCQIQLGELYLATNDFQKGINYTNAVLEKSQKEGFKEIAFNAAELLHKLYLGRKDTLKAYRYAILESQWKDSLTNGEKLKTLTRLEVQHQFDKEQSLKAIAQQRQNFIIIILILGLLIVISILFTIWTRQKMKAKNAILQKDNLEKELDFKNKEMVLNVMSLMKKNEMLADLSEKLIKIDGEATTQEGKDTIKKVARELQKSQEDEIWTEFSMRFKEVHGEFYNKLLKRFPDLGPNELKLCAFLRLNMSTKEIAGLTGQRVSSLETARHRLRQKLGISNSDVNLITFLSQL
jgi:tetratricopeptide (TPR) repeat protein